MPQEITEPIKELPECPYIIGVHCNQKEIMCDKGLFQSRCVMLALRQIDHAIESQLEYFVREGILQACHVLQARGYIKKAFNDKSSSQLRDAVVTEIEEAKAKGREWHEIGWEWAIPEEIK